MWKAYVQVYWGAAVCAAADVGLLLRLSRWITQCPESDRLPRRRPCVGEILGLVLRGAGVRQAGALYTSKIS